MEIDGVDFVSTSTRVSIGVGAEVMHWIADCLELAVVRGDDRHLHTLTGAWYPEIRTMYLTTCRALGSFKHAREVAFGTASRDT